MSAPVNYTELRDALEASLRTADAHERVKEICDFERSAGAVSDTSEDCAAEWHAAKTTALSFLHRAISSHLGEERWTVLLAGHLIHSEENGPTIIIPIEKVIHLDSLRRFP